MAEAGSAKRAALFADARASFGRAVRAAAQETRPGSDSAWLESPAAAELVSNTAAWATINFNIGRLTEYEGDITGATAKYSALLSAFPGYHDARLRLALIACAAGDIPAAKAHAAAIVDVAHAAAAAAAAAHPGGKHAAAAAALPTHGLLAASISSAHLLLGQLHESEGATAAAKAEYDAAAKSVADVDTYIYLSQANLVFRGLYASTPASAAAASAAAAVAYL